MLLVADPDRMTLLIRGLPDSLKLYAIQLQDKLRDALTLQAGNLARLRMGRALTWGEVAQQLINCGRRMGVIGTTGKQQAVVWRIESREQPPLEKSGSQEEFIMGQKN